ncbi:hypothetical protein EYF80_033254 [Liparis tanakae]|uniref:Uncharacterized protein n=1 Tax=Liparis tanakae TaxID=230148 RepID=A0A4Z2GS91_9TELE|nr:hypothetical protein EYF80_033254 [Liparis tanakae]
MKSIMERNSTSQGTVRMVRLLFTLATAVSCISLEGLSDVWYGRKEMKPRNFARRRASSSTEEIPEELLVTREGGWRAGPDDALRLNETLLETLQAPEAVGSQHAEQVRVRSVSGGAVHAGAFTHLQNDSLGEDEVYLDKLLQKQASEMLRGLPAVMDPSRPSPPNEGLQDSLNGVEVKQAFGLELLLWLDRRSEPEGLEAGLHPAAKEGLLKASTPLRERDPDCPEASCSDPGDLEGEGENSWTRLAPREPAAPAAQLLLSVKD